MIEHNNSNHASAKLPITPSSSLRDNVLTIEGDSLGDLNRRLLSLEDACNRARQEIVRARRGEIQSKGKA